MYNRNDYCGVDKLTSDNFECETFVHLSFGLSVLVLYNEFCHKCESAIDDSNCK